MCGASVHVLGEKCLFTLEGHTDMVESVRYSPNGKKLVSGSWDRTVKIWDAKTGKCLNTLKESTDIVETVCFSPQGDKIASGSKDKTIRIYTFLTLKNDFTLSTLLILKYLNHHKKQGTLQQLPANPLYLETFAQLPKVIWEQFADPFDYKEVAEKLQEKSC